ncbi:MAG: hypothetical protein LAT68_15800 [Cyclobacteriaceae bacterium]|nr:hypothetical protein [Cyclobacteriaceae bacterium]
MVIESMILFFGMLLLAASNFFNRAAPALPVPATSPPLPVPDWITDLYIYPFGARARFGSDEGEIVFHFNPETNNYGCELGSIEITGCGKTALEAFHDMRDRHRRAGYSNRHIREIDANIETLNELFGMLWSYGDPAYEPINECALSVPDHETT